MRSPAEIETDKWNAETEVEFWQDRVTDLFDELIEAEDAIVAEKEAADIEREEQLERKEDEAFEDKDLLN